MSKQKYTVTAALPYANGPLHLGHVAGVYLPSDIYVRFLRMNEEDVVYICGSDEHGAAITMRAKKEGITPQEIVDKYHVIIRDTFKNFDISFDIFYRTSYELHHKTSQDFFLKLEKEGKFIKKTTEQYYDEEFHQFLADRYITGECPRCHQPGAYGDQCEKCGADLDPTELIHPISTLSGKTPVLKTTTHWFLPMDQYEGWARKWITEGIDDGVQQHNPKEWRNQVTGQLLSWLDTGLQPRAMTRDLDWGVKVPLKEADGKVLYVWLDAPIGYISATKQWALDNGKNWEDYWKGDTKLIHFVGKDNIVFHALIFPIMLKAHGDFILENNVPASEFLNLEGGKFSTSRNWAVWLHEYLERYPDKVDEMRYVLTSIAPENKDSEFTWKDYQTRINSELGAILGNFINRSMVLTQKYYDGKVPTLGELTEDDQSVLAEIKRIPTKVSELIYAYKIREAQAEAMKLARLGNKYLADEEPWKIIKTNPERVKTVIHIALQITANLSQILQPFLPKTAENLRIALGLTLIHWNEIGNSNLLLPGTTVSTPPILFPRIEDDMIENELALLEKSKIANALEAKSAKKYPEQKPFTTFDSFSGMDIRLGKIIAAEKIKKADKLLKLTVDTGIDERTIVSGIAEKYTPEEVVGKTVAVLMNLEPRMLRGVESKGMILMAEDENGDLSFMIPERGFGKGNGIR